MEQDLGHAQTTGTLGALARDSGDEEAALKLISESAELAHSVGVDWWQGGMLAELAALSLREGRLEEADGSARESLAIAERLGDHAGQVFGIGLLASVAAERGDFGRAGRLWGAIEDEHTWAPLGGWQRHRDECHARIQGHANADFEAALTEGRELELEAAVAEALDRGGET